MSLTNSTGSGVISKAVDFDTSPLLVFYELTRACDLVCLHCRACAQRDPAPGELSTDQSLALLDQLTGFPTAPIVVFTGGDPFKRRDLIALAKHAASLGLEVAVTPSATPLVTQKRLLALREAGVSRIAVSLDGPDQETHDSFRGVSGSFQRTLDIIHDARRIGFSVQINTTITPYNWQRIGDFGTLLDHLDIILWSVFFLVPVGRATEQPRLTGEEVEVTFDRLWQESKRRGFAIKTTEAPHFRRFMAQRRKLECKDLAAGPSGQKHYSTLATNDGKGIVFVAHNGEIYPSGFMPIRAGTFPSDSVVYTYQNSFLFRALRDRGRLKGKCGACEFRALCGGSRARAYAVTGDALAEEPDCSYLPKGFRTLAGPAVG